MKNTNNVPLISIVMPAYNAERFVEQAVRSVMQQTVTEWELLVLDDGSKDGTKQILQRLAQEDDRIRFLPNAHNMGVAKTRNRGFDLCRGQYIALLDSDDLWHPDKLEKQLALLQQEDADLVYTSYAIIDSGNQKTRADYLVPESVSFDQLLKENVIGCSTVLFSAEILEKYRFSTDFFHEDLALWLCILRDGYRAVGCREVLTDWRYLENSRSFDKRKSAGNRWRIYRHYLKLPFGKSAVCFASYALRGMKKYAKTDKC